MRPPRRPLRKKDLKSKVAVKKWLDGRLMAKNLTMIIQVNLGPNPREGNTNSPKLACKVDLQLRTC